MGAILVVDADPATRRVMVAGVAGSGSQVAGAVSGDAALEYIVACQTDLVIIDPDLAGDGPSLIARIRAESDVPIIVVCERASSSAKVELLDAGADDYLTKPFSVDELLARVRAVLRRARAPVAEALSRPLVFHDVEVDPRRKLVRRRGKILHLTKTEYSLLEQFVSNPGKLLTHQWLLSKVWGPRYSLEANYLRVYVRNLRQKLGDRVDRPRFIATEPGLGYRWLPDPPPPGFDR